MTVLTLVPTRRNKDRKAKPVTGLRIGVTDDYWVIRTEDEPLNQVLDRKLWREAE